jgi:hypothetical protein
MKTSKEIIEFNKKCAEFLKYHFQFYTDDYSKVTDKIKFVHGTEAEILRCSGQWWRCSKTPTDNFSWYFPSDLKFHSDWNWIMKVKKAICELDIVNEFNTKYDSVAKGYQCSLLPSFKDTFENFYTDVFETEKKATIQTINTFLDWYNELKD